MATSAVGCYGNTLKVIYEQDDVFVHTSVPSSTLYDDIIRGSLHIKETDSGVIVEWQPVADLTPEVEYEVHSLFSGPHEYGVVTTQEKNNENDHGSITNQPAERKVKEQPYKVSFNVENIHSLRRSDPRLAWSYVVFILRDLSTQPALHFHSGGIKQMISTLQRYVWLTRSPINQKLYVVREKESVMDSTFNQFELFNDKPGHAVSKLLNSTYYGTLSGFSKVTQYVLGSMGQQDLQRRRPEKPDNQPQSSLGSGDEGEYEFLDQEEPDILGPIIPAARGSPLQPEEWCAFMNDDGTITDVKRLKERIFRGGIHGDIQKEAWKFLLGYYSFHHTYEERDHVKSNKTELYNIMKRQWSTITPAQEARFTEFANRKHIVDKDALRTDRKNPFFAGDENENVKVLNDILMTYCMYNFDLGYVQGMSDLLSPILQLMEDEVDSFWCFVGLMEKEENNFEMTQHVMKQQLENLGKLVKYLYPNFWGYLENHDSANLYFCFRWLLISFKRDFGLDELMTFWEVLWTQDFTPHFKLFICLAILEREKDIMMKRNYGFNEILKHINDIGGNIDLQHALSRAESICLQLKRKTDLPQDIKNILTGQIDGVTDSNEEFLEDSSSIENDNDNDTVMDKASSNLRTENTNINERTSNEAVVELNESTQSVF